MYFSQRELWLLTEPTGRVGVVRRFMVDTVLSIIYFILLTASAIKALVVAVHDVNLLTGQSMAGYGCSSSSSSSSSSSRSDSNSSSRSRRNRGHPKMMVGGWFL